MSSPIAGVVPSASDISGTGVTIIGTGVVTISGNAVSVSGNQVFISGQPVSISGNVVLVSGQLVSVSGVVATSVSGNMISISGQPVTVSGNMVSVSGQPAVVSGQAIRIGGPGQVAPADVFDTTDDDALATDNALLTQNRLFGFEQSSGVWVRLRVTQSGKNISGVPYKLIVTFSGDSIIGSVSGNMVSISGQPVGVSGSMVSISGQPVLVSGQLVAVSGVVAANVSGNVVYTTSGKNEVQLFAYDPSGDSLRRLIVNQSGGNVLRVDAGAINVASNVSGNVVYLTSGKNDVQVSGQTILTSVSGNALQISGQLVAVSGLIRLNDVSGGSNTVTGYPVSNDNSLLTLGFNYGASVDNQWRALRVTNSGQGVSGIQHKLVVTFSGDSIIGSVSGNAVLISGQLVAVSGTVAASVSGNMVSISGQAVSVSGNVVVASVTTNISGQVVYTASGQNEVKMMGLDLSGNTLNAIRTVASGSHTIPVVISHNTLDSNTFATVASATDSLSMTGALKTISLSEGYDSSLDQYVRTRVTTSGQLISGIAHKLVVTFSGDSIIGSVSGNMISVSGQPVAISGSMISISGQPVTISGNIINTSGQVAIISGQPVSISGNAIRPQVFDASGNVWRDILSPYSGTQAILTATNTPPTFTVYADNVVPASGGIAFAMQYRSGGSSIVLKKMFITNLEPALLSGQYIRWDICRISGLYSGATQLTARPMDPNDGQSGASLNIETNVTGSLFPTAARDLLMPWISTTQGWLISGSAVAQASVRQDMMSQAMNVLPESTEMKEIRMTSGFGVILQQTLAQTGYTQVTSGRFGINVVYTIQ